MSDSIEPPESRPAADWIAAGALASLLALVLYCVGRPVFTDDFWWHAALGGYYFEEGPSLGFDPLLFSAENPPDPASWLFAVILFAAGNAGGFALLRVLHVGLVVATLFVLARALRGERSMGITALAIAVFTMLSAYRIAQLRPEIATILLALLLATLVLDPPARLSRKRMAAITLLCAVWANLHPGFLLGPLMLASACIATLACTPLLPAPARAEQSLRARDLALTTGLALFGTLLNPQGLDAHLAYFEAGTSGADLSLVHDEWRSGVLFALPSWNLPPSPLVWALLHLVFIGAAASVVSALRAWRRGATPSWADPTLLGFTAIAFFLALLAVRFSWLAAFPLVLTVRWVRSTRFGTRGAHAIALATIVLFTAFLFLGDWPFLSRGVPRTFAGYAEPFSARKYYANAAWFLRDIDAEGRLFTAYSQGGFYGFWLAPRLKTLVNGSLNFPQATADDYFGIQLGHELRSRTDLTALLDRHEIDFFLGTGLPTPSLAGRPWRYTTSHLEGAPGWLLAYRNLNTALYVRDDEANQEQIQRIARYYEAQEVPFDRTSGLDVAGMLETLPPWSLREGVVPLAFQDIVDTAREGSDPAAIAARDRLASVYAALGLYEEALSIDRELTRLRYPPAAAWRRLAWCLLRQDRLDQAQKAARRLRGSAAASHLAAAIRRIAREEDAEIRARMASFVPFLSRVEGARLASGRARVPTRGFPESPYRRIDPIASAPDATVRGQPGPWSSLAFAAAKSDSPMAGIDSSRGAARSRIATDRLSDERTFGDPDT